MPAAIVHYHLRRGGVTRVIEAQSRVLHERGIAHVILSGTPYEGPGDLPVTVLPELDYRPTRGSGSGGDLAATMRDTAARVLGEAPSIWHIHNPSLGKNVLWPAMLRSFVEAGERMVWQHHDFAEDGRPGNYEMFFEEPALYPVAPQIRHAFINSRDRRLLIQAGIPAGNTAFLPNAVTAPEESARTASVPPGPPRVLYPVRGIRRKNLGELCLLAALAPAETRFALTLAPENRQWLPVYHRWEAFAAQNELPLDLGVVDRVPPAPGVDPTYANWIAHSSHLLTTSVAEGFGLAFLEPIAMGKPLFGRDLPEITADFRNDGLHLGDLYEHLLVPAAWVDLDALRQQLAHDLRETYRSYGRELPPAVIEAAFAALFHGDRLDFGNLPEALQEAT
ncbi:MAG: glycosyltransferase, partial [Akkermansiaceae bacterium]|nr:glycosyltransferase [Akkermansiaceae bacterium]